MFQKCYVHNFPIPHPFPASDHNTVLVSDYRCHLKFTETKTFLFPLQSVLIEDLQSFSLSSVLQVNLSSLGIRDRNTWLYNVTETLPNFQEEFPTLRCFRSLPSCYLSVNTEKKWSEHCQEWGSIMRYIDALCYYSAIKKSGILPFLATWMELEDTVLSRVSQVQKYKYCVFPLLLEA